MDGLFYLIGVILLLIFAFFVFKREKKMIEEENLRRETIKNSLCDIATYLKTVAEYYVSKDIK